MTDRPAADPMNEAISWHIRLRDGADRDWDEFVAWLEGDPARAAAYDRVEAGDAAIAPDAFRPVIVPPAAANDETPVARRHIGRLAAGFGAVAAAILIALLAVPFLSPRADRFEIATAAGQRRTVHLADGGTVALNGATRLVLDRNDPRYAELLAGEAVFTIQHRADRPFTVVAGDHRVQDVGTSFNLVYDRSEFAVEVIEGSVTYNPDRSPTRLGAGQTLRVAGTGSAPVAGRADPQALGSWRVGRLNYAGAPLARVARDLARSLGVEIAIDARVAAVPFTGSIRLESPTATVASLAASAALHARRSGDGWVIEP